MPTDFETYTEKWFAEQEITPISFQETNDAEADRLIEIGAVTPVIALGRDWEGIIVAYIADNVAERMGTHSCFYVYSDGKVAQANCNQPQTFATFEDLYTAA